MLFDETEGGRKQQNALQLNICVLGAWTESSFCKAASGFQFLDTVSSHAEGTNQCLQSSSLFFPAHITGRDRWKLEIAGLSSWIMLAPLASYKAAAFCKTAQCTYLDM